MGVLAILMVFSIPILAILTNFVVRLQRLKVEEKHADKNEVAVLREQLNFLITEQEDLREKLRNLEGKIRLPTKGSDDFPHIPPLSSEKRWTKGDKDY